MKKFRVWAVVATFALLLTVFSAGKIFAVADETKAEDEMMVDGLAWNADVTTLSSDPLKMDGIVAKEVIIEGGNTGVVRINGGNIDKVTVKAPEVPEFGFKEIVELIAAGVPVNEVVEMYRNNQKLKDDATALKPTVKVVGGAEIDELIVSGSAVLDLAGGDVEAVTVKAAADTGRMLVTIKNYDGKLNVDQVPNTDGTNNIVNVELKNTQLAELNVDGEKKCVFHIGGDNKSDVAAMVVEGSSDVVTMVDTTDVKVAESAEKSSVRIYSDVENLVVEADNSNLYVAASAVVTNAKVTGDNTTVGFNGRVDNSEVTGSGSQVVYQAPPTATPSPTPSPKPVGTVIGNENNTTGWWTAHSETIKVEEGETEKLTFWNFTGGVENWHNFLVILQNVGDAHAPADNAAYAEYGVFRADNWGWKGALNPVDHNDQLKWVLESQWNWDTFKTDMNGAKVDLEVTNNGDTADIVANITTEAGKKYFQNYKNIAIDGDLYFCLTVEGGHLIIPKADAPVEPEQPVEPEEPVVTPEAKPEITLEPIPEAFVETGKVLGKEDNTTPWWNDFTKTVKVEEGTAARVYFQNYGGAAAYNNFAVILQDAADGAETVTEYAVVRADNYGWLYTQNTFDHLEALGWKLESNWNWDTFVAEMKDATVVLDIVNYGKTADVLATITTATGEVRYQKYLDIAVDGDLYYRLCVDGAHIEFLEPAPVRPEAPELVVLPKAEDCSAAITEIVEDVTENDEQCITLKYEDGAEETHIMTWDEEKEEYFVTYHVEYADGSDLNGTYAVADMPEEMPKVGDVPYPAEEEDDNLIGTEDGKSAWWGAHSETFKVEEGTSKTIVFKNYGGANNWNNFVVVLQNIADEHAWTETNGYKEYAVLRADNCGWGWFNGTWCHDIDKPVIPVGCKACNWNWDTLVADMSDATVELTVSNYGETADVVANVTTATGATYFQKYTGITVDSDLYYCLTVDNCYLVIEEVKDAVELPKPTVTPTPTKKVLGAEDFSTPWWTVFSEGVKVEAGKSETVTFKNYTKGEFNHQNFVVFLKTVEGNSDAAGYREYAALRPDNWGWLYEKTTGANLAELGWKVESDWVWGTDGATFRSDMNGATVELTITNHGTTADVVANITTVNGEKRFQKFLNIKVDGDLYYSLSVENAYLVFE